MHSKQRIIFISFSTSIHLARFKTKLQNISEEASSRFLPGFPFTVYSTTPKSTMHNDPLFLGKLKIDARQGVGSIQPRCRFNPRLTTNLF